MMMIRYISTKMKKNKQTNKQNLQISTKTEMNISQQNLEISALD